MNETNEFLKSYQKCQISQEIMGVFYQDLKSPRMLLWQNQNGKRFIFNGGLLQINQERKQILIRTPDLKNNSLVSNLPIYIRMNFRQTVLKTQIEFISGEHLQLKIPNEIFWQELRNNHRTSFPMGKKISNLRLEFGHVTTSNLSAFKVSIKDISKQGLGLFVSANNQHLFKRGQLIDFLNLGNAEMSTPLRGEVVFCSKDKKSELLKETWFQVGVKMHSPFSDSMIRSVCDPDKSPNAKQTILDLDCFSDEFKQKIEVEVSSTLKEMKQNTAIAKYLAQLELSRNKDLYLEEHIKVLTIVSTFIARSMNWVSELTLQKLIYVAYLHDAPLFSHPHLAKIADIQEFEKMKSILNPEEQKLFLTAPETAAGVAFSDKASPPDAPQMLLMQKERPMGNGFPKGLNSSKITALAALFIVAHDLTDEMIKTKDWSMDRWLMRAKKVYKGGQFSKIMEVLETSKSALNKQTKSH
jgi:hypothetical protein